MRCLSVVGYENYLIDELGTIYGLRGRRLRPGIGARGYKVVWMKNSQGRRLRPIHRLLADTLFVKPEGTTEVNHKNGIKTDNRLENLEWVTRQENAQHAYDIGLNVARPGPSNPNAVWVLEDIGLMCQMRRRGSSVREICEYFGAAKTTVHRILNDGRPERS